jgi:DNA-binding IclR family transcriptional regulator
MASPESELDDGKARRSGVQVISRAAAILHLLAREPTGLTLTEVVTRTELAKSTAYRILLALEEEQIVESFDGRYRIGRILARSALSETEQVRLRARPFMERLATELQETVDLAVLVGDQIMIIDQMRWVRELTAGSSIGSMLPAVSTASGLALLACSPAYEEFTIGLQEMEPSELEAFKAQIAHIREEQLACVEEGYHVGISGFATFAQDEAGNAFALGVPVPSVRFVQRSRAISKTLLEAQPEFQRIVSGR